MNSLPNIIFIVLYLLESVADKDAFWSDLEAEASQLTSNFCCNDQAASPTQMTGPSGEECVVTDNENGGRGRGMEMWNK